jgi:putative spermidine/putrescine transport system permease protein
MSTATSRRRKQQVLRVVVLLVVGAFFAIPLWSMFKFSIKDQTGVGTWAPWRALVDDSTLRGAIKNSVELAFLTALLMLLLLLPTMVWVRLKVPWAKRVVEFLCLLPLTIPAIVIVVGISDVMAWVTYLVTEGPLALTFPYVILVLPYCYRALDAGLSSIDVNTLSEAARSLGASWFTVIARVIIPNVKSAVLSAAFLAVAVVLGEYTFASLLHYDTLQVAIAQYGLSNARVSMSASLATLAFAFVLLFGLSFVGGRRKQKGAS